MAPQVFGIKGDSRLSVQVNEWSHMDGGANICLTGDLGILTDAVNIPPLPIMVGLNGNGSLVDDCCTKLWAIFLSVNCVAILQMLSKPSSPLMQFSDQATSLPRGQ